MLDTFLNIKLRISLFAVGMFWQSANTTAQDTAHVYMFGGPYLEEGSQLVALEAGGYVIAGTTGSDQNTYTNIYLTRLDDTYECVWNLVLGGNHAEWGKSACEAPNGDILVCGYTGSFGNGGYDVIVYRVSSSGAILWQRTYGGGDWDFGNKIIVHPEDGFLLCGLTYSIGNGSDDGYLVHIDDNGDIIDEWTYGGVGRDEFMDVDIDLSSNRIYLSGSSQPVNSPDVQFSIWAIDLDGIVQWHRTDSIPGLSSSIINSVLIGELIYSCGNFLDDDGNKLGFLTSVYVDDGHEFWHQYEDHNGNFVFNDLAISDGVIYLAGYTNAYGDGSDNGLISVKGIYGEWLNSLTIGTELFAFNSILVHEGRFKGCLRALHEETDFSLQAAVYEYPDLSFEATSISEWFTTACFTIDVGHHIGALHEATRYLVFDLTGRKVIECSVDEFPNFSDILSGGVYFRVATDRDGIAISSDVFVKP